MAFGDVYVCRRCGTIWTEDDQQWEEPDCCPHCGAPKDDEGDMSDGGGN